LVIDTENKTSAKYARLLGPYDILPMSNYSIKTYIEALEYSARQAYDVVIVDSLSHAWAGKGGALEQAEQAKSKYGGNKFAAWGDVTPLQNKLVDTILSYPAHLIATMRMKIEYALITGDNGRQQVSKLGLGIIQRDSFEYEFDIIAQMDVEHNLTITKTRCFELDGFMAHKPDGAMGQVIAGWLGEGQPMPPKEPSYEPVDAGAIKATEQPKNGQLPPYSTEDEGTDNVPPKSRGPVNSKPTKPFKFPSSAAQDFFIEIESATDSYWQGNGGQFVETMKQLGVNWSILNDADKRINAWAALTDHARQRRAETSASQSPLGKA
jgi:hypothetical protein